MREEVKILYITMLRHWDHHNNQYVNPILFLKINFRSHDFYVEDIIDTMHMFYGYKVGK